VKKNSESKAYAVVDLFCGVGGLTHGFVKEKFSVKAGIDFDDSCQYAYEKNNGVKFIKADLTEHPPEEIASLFPDGSLKILVGCAPCQAFSTYTQGQKKNNKWKLLYSFGEIISVVQPDVISMENVFNLTNYKNGQVFCDFLSVLYANDYYVTFDVVNAQDYGVPQRRNRLILFASKFGAIKIPKKSHYGKQIKTVRHAIGMLPAIHDGQPHEKDLLHRARKLSPLNLKRIRATRPGGGWQQWEEDLVLECHKKESGKSYRSVYGRMVWDDVSPTLTTQCTGYGNGRFGHPEQDRAISLREAAILQSFPRKYDFINPDGEFHPSIIEKHIGNAVPVRLGKVIAKTIREHIKLYA
jgi:DNA (cytosine-5)-methyltransferase 1